MSGNELGHKCVADGPEAQLGPKIIRGLNESALIAVGVKDASLSVVVQFNVGAALRRHLAR
jgi:hypothetical protein